jgi:nicotinamide-nucleotide amidase
MGAEIFSVGTELLLGQIIDTNAAYLGQQLARLGIDCFHQTTVGDNTERLAQALRTALLRSRLIITTGGLGPTEDDVTAAAVARAFELELALHEPSAEAIRRLLAARNFPFIPAHLKQAYIPAGAQALPNPVGTAPGFIAEKDGNTVISLPGPPPEMKPMFEQSVAPYLRQLSGGGTIHSRVLRFMGIGESLIEDKLKDLIAAQSNPTIAPLASHGLVRIRLTAKAATEAEARALIAPVEVEILRRMGEFIVGSDEDDVEATVGRLLREKGLKLAVAESCTGGLIGHRLTNIPGASDYFLAGLVGYGNKAKQTLLRVPEETLNKYGAVSRETALAMARGAREAGGADFGLADTGIAGPGGGSEAKPVGLVYGAIVTANKEHCEEFRFRGERDLIKWQASGAALNLLRRALEGYLPGFID